MPSEMDDLEADLRAAQESLSPPAPDAEVTPEPASDIQTPEAASTPTESERARDEAGRFAKAEKARAEQKAEKPKAPVQAEAVKDGAASATPATPQTEAPKVAPPPNWKGAGKVAWERLPEPVRKEIAEDYTRLAQTQAQLDELNSAIGQERSQILSATYGSVKQGLNNLFAISDLATKNPTGFVLWFAQQRGINLAQMVGQAVQQGDQPAHATHPLEQEVSQLKTMLTNFVQQQQGTQTQGLQSEIERFASDPSHPYFNDVRADMGVLIQAGRAKDLQQAYDMAIWAHPEIRTSLIEGQVQQKTQAQTQAAQQARAASVSVSGSPAGAKVQTDEPDETLEQTLRRAQQRVLNA